MREIQIGGLVPFTTIDYPGKLAAVLFLVGCPLRCAYCSNPHLLCPHDGEYDPEKTFEWLKARVGKLEAIVFSGGEALMQGNIAIEYMKRVRDLGFKIGLHTNGFYPELLKKVDLEKEIKENTSLKPNVKITGPLSMSDHMSFIGAKEHICLLAKDKSIYSLVSHIHSKKDNFIKEQNILDVVDIVRNYTNKKLFSTKKHLTQAINKKQIDFSL